MREGFFQSRDKEKDAERMEKNDRQDRRPDSSASRDFRIDRNDKYYMLFFFISMEKTWPRMYIMRK